MVEYVFCPAFFIHTMKNIYRSYTQRTNLTLTLTYTALGEYS